MKWPNQLFSRRRLYGELSEEIREHLEEKIEELVAGGMPRKEAVAAARRELGNVSLIEQDSREVWRWPSIEDFLMDVRYGLRQLCKSPGFTAVAVLTLALGIGANTAIFNALDAVMLKSLPVYRPDQLVLFADTVGQGWTSSNTPPADQLAYFPYELYTYFKNQNRTFQDICAFRNALDNVNVRVDGVDLSAGVQLASPKQVSGNYFDVLGVNAILGRTLTPSDDQPTAPPAAVISFRYWSARFNRDASVLGRALEANGVPFTIVGVAPPEFFGERVESNPADLWVPLAFQPRLMQRESWLENGAYYWLDLIGRLKQGVSIEQAQAAVNVQLHQYFTEQAGSHLSRERQGNIDASKVELSPGGRGISYMRLFYSEPLHVLMGGVLIILLIACANVATLLLARAAGRPNQEMSVAPNAVGPRYFETEGMPLLLGRPITAQDVKGSPEVAVVNEAFVRSFLSNANPIGRRFGPGAGDPQHSGEVEIVGVVKDAKFFSLCEQPPPMVFLSLFQAEGDMAHGGLEIRAAGDPRNIAEEVRQDLAETDKSAPMPDVRTMPEQIHSRLNQERAISELSSFFGILAVLLACLGLYGLMSYTVARQTNEIGVRMALGANQGDVVWSILGQGARLAIVGVVLGSGAAFALMRLISNLLYGVSTHDPLTFASVAVLLMFVALLASFVPARQASRVDPMVALRYE